MAKNSKDREFEMEREENIPETIELDNEQQEIDPLQEELNNKTEQYLRLAAEYDNFRKRSQKEREGVFSEAKASVLTGLLPVLDNIDRAKEIEDPTSEEFKKGIDMIFTQFEEILAGLGVESFGAPGEPFDPNIHNAVMHVEDENMGENTIVNVFVKGYKVGDRVLRPAMVQVAN